MRALIEFLLVIAFSLGAPMAVCEVTFPMGGLGSSICGHNGWIQIFVYFVIGTTIVLLRTVARRKAARALAKPPEPN